MDGWPLRSLKMKTYIGIFYILINAVVFSCEVPEKERPYVSLAPSETLTKVFKEPLLTDPQFKNKDIYRFTIFPTFGKPMTFRLEVLTKSKGTIHYKRLSGKGGYEIGVIDISSTNNLKGKEFTELLKVIKNPKAHQPYGNLTKADVDLLGGLDGSNWYLESITNKVYSCSYVWTADALPATQKLLLEDGWGDEAKHMKRISQQLNPKPFISACLALAKAAGYELNNGLEAFKPIK